MKKLFLLFALFVSGIYPSYAQIEIKAVPSETVELMYIMMLLTEAPAINAQRILPEYKAFADSYFAKYKSHSAIKFIVAKLMNKNLIEIPAPAAIGVNSEIVNGRFVYIANIYGWNSRTHERFEEEVNKFYRDTNFRAFWEKARDNMYPLVSIHFNDNIVPRLNLEWLNEFIPVDGTPDYGLTISLLGGEFNFGVARNGIPNPVLGIAEEYVGLIINPTPKTFETYIPLIVHEYLHPFCNPMIDKYYSELESAGEVIFPKIREQATRAHYGEWRIVLYESLVRASEIAFMRSDDFLRQSTETAVEGDKRIGFYWTGELAELLAEYEANRDRYPTLDSFMPRIVDFYRKLADAGKPEN